MTNNNRKAPREFWISQIYESSIDVFLTEMEAIKAAWNEDSQNVIHVREVLPNEPSAEEVFERVKKDFETLKTALLKISVRCEGSMHQQDFHRIRELTHECFAAIAESRKV